MKSIYLLKFLNFINYILVRIILLFISSRKRITIKNTILVTRLDSIGDYILFRNYLNVLKSCKKFKDYSITLCGNIIWKDLAETFDSNVVNDFIWIDRKKFYSNIFYKYKNLKYIYNKGFEVAIDSAYTREVIYSDIIIKASCANIKIGSKGSLDKHAFWKRRFFSDSFYDKVIEQTDNILFEFYRNKDFFEKIIEDKISIEKPVLNLSGFKSKIKLPDNYLVIFPGAADEKRRWNGTNFLKVTEFLINEFQMPVVIAGSVSEKEICKMISKKINSELVINLTTKTTLSQLTKIISNARLLISNDTGAVHIAAAVDKKFFCISNGNHFGRFTPYPNDIFKKAHYIYPREIMDNINNEKMLSEKYRFNSDLDINNITIEEVKNKIKELL